MGKVTLPKGFDPSVVNHWYLVANQADALFYEGILNGTFHFLERLENPQARLSERELAADRPGRTFSSSPGQLRHGFAPHSRRHEIVAEKFARRVAERLSLAAHERRFSDLVILAEPHFLGLLNGALSKEVKALVRREVAREWARGSDDELREFLKKKLA